MANKLCDSNKRVIGNITDVVRTVDGETMITLDTGHTFQFKSYDIYWDSARNAYIKRMGVITRMHSITPAMLLRRRRCTTGHTKRRQELL